MFRPQHLLTAMLLAAAMVFIMPNDSNAQDTITTSSGLRYVEHDAGAGEKAKAGDHVIVHYTGWLYVDGEKGSKFDSSVDRGQPFNFPLGAGRVIGGWDEGVAGMRPGGKRTLIIPPALGYGARGAGGVIPPNATLMFDVELIEIR
ncbi:MAG: FKBP-type peptidyl-prolyl cis-trans isomerase [Proteobacteria bacterium]|nr:FKBP-type peptidyl-prolyl cis-trans isomerase [Pseudomonadota bacterium]